MTNELSKNDPQQEHPDRILENTLLALRQLIQDAGIIGVQISTDPDSPDARTSNERIEFTRTTVLHEIGRISVIAHMKYKNIQFGEKTDLLDDLRKQWEKSGIKLQDCITL